MMITKEFEMKLISLQKRHAEDEDIMVNLKEFGPDIAEGDIIEIYDPDEDLKLSRLLLQIPTYPETFGGVQKGTICIESSIVAAFQLRPFQIVKIRKVDPEQVSLELIELTFKDQYLSRSDMWRLKKSLIDSVMHLNKKIEYCSGTIRCQLHEMWTKGEKVTCGIVKEDTKIVFRSSTCQAYLFIQMSSEMWEFDIYGDLYFEKAVNGFLAELFTKWKKEGSNHDVTIVLFSRNYYEAAHIDEFPEHMRDCLQEDYQGRFYEDFYRVAVQNERHDDWMPIINHLRSLFYTYMTDVLEYHQQPGVQMPNAYNSSAPQGNFLEVLNISLNVFEKHFQDRSLERTGQMSVVITPGVGVFEVDRELTNITKQRIIDNGVGSDLVCVGEQPFHAVPLLKFHKKGNLQADDYSMPHRWINLSYYSSNKALGYGSYIPRIKLPSEISSIVKERMNHCPPLSSKNSTAEEDSILSPIFNFDAHDAQVFKLPTNQSHRNNWSLQRTPARKKTTSQSSAYPPFKSNYPHKLSDPDIYRSSEMLSSSLASSNIGSLGNLLARSPAINIPPCKVGEYKSSLKSIGVLNIEGGKFSQPSELEDLSPSCRSRFGSSNANSPNDGNPHGSSRFANSKPSRSLINPFDPSHAYVKRTSNSRRWIHIFPKGPTGILMQQHHYRLPSDFSEVEDLSFLVSDENTRRTSKERRYRTSSREDGQWMKHSTLLWGATGEQKWNAEITTGVDWKSLSLPACLPLTTDYFPDKLSFHNDYVIASNYSLDPDYFGEPRTKIKGYTNAYDVFMEVVRQRLAQGFQFIIPSFNIPQVQSVFGSSSSKSMSRNEEYTLSIGRVFHWITYSDSSIVVNVYKPRHPYPQLGRKYKYRFRSHHLDKYEISWTEFKTERLEDFKWNYLDNYLCLRGDPRETTLVNELKYWRFRVIIVPDAFRMETKRLTDGPHNTICDIFHTLTHKEQQIAIENFLKFLEGLYKIKKRTKNSAAARERLGSQRMTEKPRFRSATTSKTSGRVKYESGNKEEGAHAKMPLEIDDDYKEEGEVFSLKNGQSEIVEAMKDMINGVPFISSFPPLTFISADATFWICQHVEEISSEESAIAFLKSLLDAEIIRPLRGNCCEFKHGFVLYTFSPAVTNPAISDELPAESKWADIIFSTLNKPKGDHPVDQFMASLYPSYPIFLQPQLPTHLDAWSAHYSSALDWKLGLHSSSYIDIDVGNKSDRYEWGHLKFMTQYSPLQGYELILQWMCATGPIVTELILMWQRKAALFNLHLFPVPNDPFASAHSFNSNPLRGPVVIPLDVDCLREGGKEVFWEYPLESRAQRLFLLQEAILEKFGFMRYIAETEDSLRYRFVHVTGFMFALIRCSDTPTEVPKTDGKCWICPKASMEKPGFIWTFNFMMSKRWKSTTSGDEALAEKILRDLKAFCSNTNMRLRDFYTSCLCSLEEPLSPTSTQPFVDVEVQ